ncbi:MAG: TIGR02147 family protein [Bdellovibrionaceae bacterium]|nr:TIGR02147 family protein [Pseudobdellovibrionaceae bacterium]
MTEQFEDYTQILKQELATRNLRNSRYSLRAFSRDLGISPAQLSRILSGKAVPSKERVKQIAKAMGYKDEKLTWFCALVEASHGKNQEIKDAALETLKKYEKGVSTKKIKAEDSLEWNWHHFAIRRMTQLFDFQSSCEWIGRRLGIGLRRAKIAVEELVRFGALSIINGKIELRENYSVFYKGGRKKGREKMESDLFARCLPSILDSSRERSHHARHFFTLNKKQINELKSLINKFENQVDDLTYKSEFPDDLFCLRLDLWSLIDPSSDIVSDKKETSLSLNNQ